MKGSLLKKIAVFALSAFMLFPEFMPAFDGLSGIVSAAQVSEAQKQQEADNLRTAILGTNASAGQVKEALNLMSEGPLYGCDITWQSSNTAVVGTSGRVTNPKWDETAVNVTLTATVGGTKTVTIPVTVIPHRYLGDVENDRVSDRELFGVWNGTQWTTPSMLDYDRIDGLSDIEAAVKANNYTEAKEELLAYMRSMVAGDSGPGGNSRYVSYLLDGGMDCQNNTYYLNSGSVNSGDYKQITVDLQTRHAIKANSTNTYHIMSKKNDAVSMIIAGSTYPTATMRPKLRLYVNGSPRTYNVADSATLRTGSYAKTALNQTSELTVKTFGEFMGNETYSSIMKFGPFNDIGSSDAIGKAELVFYAKKSNDYSEPKEFNVMMQPDTSWNSASVYWKYFTWQYYNYPGLYEGKEWDISKHPSYEHNYDGMSKRFQRQHYLGAEFVKTGNEEYAYSVIRDMLTFMDFFEDTRLPLTTAGKTVSSQIRMENWIGLFKQVANSKYMTPDVCTAFVKRYTRNIEAHCFEVETPGNGAVGTYQVLLEVFEFFDLLKISPEYTEDVVGYIQGMIDKLFFSDGAYGEDTTGYASGVLSSLVEMRKYMDDRGIEVPESFDEMLLKGAIYDLMMYGPNDELLGYGDGSLYSDQTSGDYSYLADLLNSEELRFLNSNGEEGTQPSWTSLVLPVSTYAFLQDSWNTDATKLLFNVRAGGMHGNRDDNHINLFAFGKRLLTDAGKITYTMGEVYDRTDSTLSHNTVTIDDVSQEKRSSVLANELLGQGTVEASALNENFDLVSLRSEAYEDIDNYHTRTVTFVKPDFFIVSDLMTPEDNDEHDYKQAWHMVPEAELSTTGDGIIRSNFDTNGNLLIKNADDYDLETAVGIHETGMGGYAEPIFGYYHVKATGDKTIDTILLPYDSDDAELDVERINLGVPTSQATALKIMSEKDNVETTSYYILDYDKMHGTDTNHTERTFGKYKTDAMMAVVVEDANEDPTEFIVTDGSYIESVDGSMYVDFGAPVSDASVEFAGSTVNITVSDDTELDVDMITLKVDDITETITLNGKSVEFTTANGVVTLIGIDKTTILGGHYKITDVYYAPEGEWSTESAGLVWDEANNCYDVIVTSNNPNYELTFGDDAVVDSENWDCIAASIEFVINKNSANTNDSTKNTWILSVDSGYNDNRELLVRRSMNRATEYSVKTDNNYNPAVGAPELGTWYRATIIIDKIDGERFGRVSYIENLSGNEICNDQVKNSGISSIVRSDWTGNYKPGHGDDGDIKMNSLDLKTALANWADASVGDVCMSFRNPRIAEVKVQGTEVNIRTDYNGHKNSRINSVLFEDNDVTTALTTPGVSSEGKAYSYAEIFIESPVSSSEDSGKVYLACKGSDGTLLRIVIKDLTFSTNVPRGIVEIDETEWATIMTSDVSEIKMFTWLNDVLIPCNRPIILK